jgi:hypothetical protein
MRLVTLTSSLAIGTLASAGTFDLTPGTWSNFSGTAASLTSLWETKSEVHGASIRLSALNVNEDHTLIGRWNFTIKWTPADSTAIAPASVVITLALLSTLTVAGDGLAKIIDPITNMVLDEVSSSDLDLSGCSTKLEDLSLTFPLVLQPDGTYKATGFIRCDRLRAHWNSLSPDVAVAEETFHVQDMVGGN